MASAPQVGALCILLTELSLSDIEHNMVSQLHICMFGSMQSPSRTVKSLEICCLKAIFQLMVVVSSVCAGQSASVLCIHSLLDRQSAPSLLGFLIRAVVLILHSAVSTAKQGVCKPDADCSPCRCPFAAFAPA